MIKGMTGYGQAAINKKDLKAIVEVKSVNHRYLDINYYLPIGYGSLEDKIKNLLRKDVHRGRFTVSLKFIEKHPSDVILNKDVVDKYLKHIKYLQKNFQLSNDVSLKDVIGLPGVFECQETNYEPNKIWPEIERSLKRAMLSLVRMRKREGQSIAKALGLHMREMNKYLRAIKTRSKSIVSKKRKDLLVEEFMSFQKSIDINEELERLDHFLAELKKLLQEAGPVGKRIDFMAQEMQRETNTIGSKIQDKDISNHVICMKSRIEKIREQAQNIE